MPGHVFLLDAHDVLDTLVIRSDEDLPRSIRRFLPLALERGNHRTEY